MKSLVTFFTIILLVVFFAACQKELQFDVIPNTGEAKGTLKSASGGCLPSSINGSYFKDTALNATNFIEVTLDITKAGWYKITTDTVAGMYFTDSGSVNEIRLHTIQLKGKGIPTSTGPKIFTVKFGTSSCKISLPVTTVANPNAAYTFNCGSTTFGSGVYNVNTAVGATHTVTLSVNVTNLGAYTISTGAVSNGLSYATTGTFTTLGLNTVTLTANGIPTAGGSFNYTASNGTVSCVFSITVLVTPPPPTANLDYIPQTSFTNWSSKLVGGTPSDTTFIQVSANSKTFGANTYKIFEIKDMGTPTDSLFNRKNGGLYYQYIDGDLGALDNPINKEYLVLDSTKAVTGTWSANLGSNSAGGIPITNITITAVILGKGETQTVASIVYNNVIRVKYTYTATVFGIPTPVAEEERWFARGVGVIYSKINNQIGGTTIETELTRSQIF